jgi:hypothetical protein
MTVSIKGGNSATTTSKILDRPYVGLWKPNFRKTLSYAPDALVYINGDTSLVGCKDCNNRIDFQPYITQVSCGAGVEASSGDANISFSIPKHHGDSIFKDGAFLITPGLEVNIYIRGVFDVKDLNNDEIVEYPDSEKYNLKDLKMKPYYPVFHGVVTSISYAYGGGFYSGSFSCNNLLYFWQYQSITTNGAAFAGKPSESAGGIPMTGHKFTGQTPHQIIYSLFRDTGGSAQGVIGGINKKSNVNARVGNQDAFSLTLRYWERRFSQGMYGLRMHGASGRLFSSLEQVYYGSANGRETNKVAGATVNVKNKNQSKTKTADPLGGIDPFARRAGIVKIDGDGTNTRILSRGLDVKQVEAQSESDKRGSTTADMQAYILDIGNLANINMWEASYETKQQIASTVAEKVNFEFYQDVDGDLVFKPPLYNLNTKASRVYVLKPEDIVSMNFSVKEPQYTYAVVKGTLTKNMSGVLDDEFITPKSTYIDYRLVAKYGWRPLEIDSNIHTNTTSAFYYAAAELDRQNQEAETASVTITLRPELKPGYPVYIEHIDCFYYVTSVSHDFTYGSSCSTTIEIKARRKRFMPPGDMNVSYKEAPDKAVDLINTNKGAKYLKKKEKTVGTSGIEGEEIIKVTGFPNVVMGIDMTRIDPNFFFMGTETLEIEKPYFKNMIIAEALNLGVLQYDSNSSKDPFAADAKFVVFDVVENGKSREIGIILGSDIAKGQQNIGNIIPAYQKSLDKIAGDGTLKPEQKADKRQAVEKQRDQAFNDLTSVDNNTQSVAGQTKSNVSFVYSEEYTNTLLNPTDGRNTPLTLLDLINIMRVNKQRANEVSSGMGSTANILELLANKKNAFSPHIPGYFRYFSCSHPDPKMQGATEIEFADDNGVIKSVGERLIKTSEERYNGNKVNMVVPDPTSTDGDLVTFTQAYPTAGLKVKNSFTNQIDVIATNEITSLTFQEHDVLIKTIKVKNKKDKQELWVGLPPGLYRDNKDIIKRQFIYDFIKNGLKINIKNATKETLFPIIITKTIQENPDILAKVKAVIASADALFKENTYVKEFEKRETDLTNELEKLLEYAAGNLWQAILEDHKAYFDIKIKITEQTESQFKTTKEEYLKLSKALFALTEIVIPPINKPNSTLTAKNPEGFIKPEKTKKSMVLPVSDDEGYEVYGYQAYGRGLDLKVGGGYMSLLQQDYSRVLTSAQSENIYKILKTVTDATAQLQGVKAELNDVAETLNQMTPEERNIIINSTGIITNQNSENADKDGIVEAFITQFANRIVSNQETDKFGKEDTNRFVVAENIPRALNQIAPGGIKNSGSVCQCRGYDSDLDLENLDEYNTPYVKLDFSGAEEDKFSQKLHDVMIEKGKGWKEQQEIYRGADTLESSPVLRNLADTTRGAVNNLINTVNRAEENFVTITETYSSTLDAIDQKEKKALENNATNNVLYTENKKG